MPTYAYACKDCGHAFDIAQSFSDDSLTECPQCQGRLRKKFGNVGVTFKGSGFYRNDSRGSSSTSDAKSTSSPAAGESSTGSGSSESGSKETSGAGAGKSASSDSSSSSTGSNAAPSAKSSSAS